MFDRARAFLSYVCIAACGGLVLPSQAQTWQQSISLQVELGVRDKFGQSDAHTVVFTVKDPTGATSAKAVKAKGDEFVSARFPGDFNTYFKRGRYAWTASVGGKEVAAGRFSYEPVEFGERLTTSHQ